jgi:hypothetical protein
VLDGLFANPRIVFSEMSDVDKAASVFVLLREKVVCKDKRLQTTDSLVPPEMLETKISFSPA